MSAQDVVGPLDVAAAQAATDGLDELVAGFVAPAGWHAGRWTEAQTKTVRAFMAGFAADCRWAGYLEGEQHGRRQVAHVVRDALEGEGL